MTSPVGTIVCRSCSGSVRKDASACAYCGAVVLLPPPKGADLPAEVKTYCTRCGQLYRSTDGRCPRCPPGSTDARGGRCPRCAADLEASTENGVTIDRCSACKGTWFDGDELEHAMDLTTRGATTSEAYAKRRALPTGSFEAEVRYLACVRCGERMVRRMVAARTGIIVDICRDHGVWFDGGELEQLAAFVRAGGLDVVRHDGIASMEARRREAERAKDVPAALSDPAWGTHDVVGSGYLLSSLVRFVTRVWPL